MSEHWNELTGDRADLATALTALVGTELDEQVFIACREDVGEQPDPLLDIAHMEEESGDGRYQIYVTLPPGATLDGPDLAWPTGVDRRQFRRARPSSRPSIATARLRVVQRTGRPCPGRATAWSGRRLRDSAQAGSGRHRNPVYG